MQKPEDFSKFYYAKVGMGEACGCAEKIIDVYEFNRRGGKAERTNGRLNQPAFSWRRMLRKYGLLSRPKTPE